jgi:hypothetical protein
MKLISPLLAAAKLEDIARRFRTCKEILVQPLQLVL